jgi:hypothetical protein
MPRKTKSASHTNIRIILPGVFVRFAAAAFLKLLFDVVLPAETLNPSGGVHQLLLTRKEGVAGGTDLHLNVPGGGTGFDNIAASAGNFGEFVLGMDAFFHCSNSMLYSV